ncbi:tripartite tricarboxylate transporter permease [Marinovum sp. 2_MG-2023]|uniref:tripartite tricarboxylate transporter permease n=1 Tax=unclassified Marinovum TaxID=2647166 RepID=UPI0026E393A2|nr:MULTISPECIES: tripartite tricarboxylate transporter permease [unclassified Marinovum]MDO6732802.1 tripartite tricarboxylate transporter permease [Marinovum sp. 2_MG-2023]MDO6782071.1 tripartite tricarboxylate transporter permease [Marinovum sp. 1_MG-2023]
MDTINSVLSQALTFSNILFVAAGIFLGYVVGAMPGLGKVTAAAIAIPLTYAMNPVSAIGFLVGIAKGSTAGNAVSAILINTPGEPSSVPTAMDGYPLARQGKGVKAMKVALVASTVGDFFSTWLLIFLTAPLASVAVQIGKVELASILVFAMTFIAALSGTSLSKGLISGMIGILLASVGLEVETGTQRMTFGSLLVFDGLPLIAMAIGIVAVAEMVLQFEEQLKLRKSGKSGEKILAKSLPEDNHLSPAELRQIAPTIFRGTLVGGGIGLLPGLGAAIASFASYGLARKISKDEIAFGSGNIKGVAAAESADNAVIPASLITLFALGIPGSVIAAILAAGFTMHGIIPGPLMMRENPEFMQGLFGSMLLASVLMLAIGWIGMRFFARVITLPFTFLFSGVFFFSAVGAYLQGGGVFGVFIMSVFGVVGYFLKRFDFSFVTFIIGFIIGPQLELAIRQSLIITKGSSVWDYPLALVFGLITLATILRVGWTTVQRLSGRTKVA